MLERLWLILIFVLAGIVPPMQALQQAPPAHVSVQTACALPCCVGGCTCEACPCANEGPIEKPGDQEPAIPASEREQKRSAEPRFEFVDLVLPELGGPRRLWRNTAEPILFNGVDRPESLLCVWRI